MKEVVEKSFDNITRYIENAKNEIECLKSSLSLHELPTDSLEDQMKLDFLAEHWDEFTSFDMHKLLQK